jgi:hypothetical protein
MSNSPRPPASISLAELFGVTAPLSKRLDEIRLALLGDGDTPKTKFGVSSLKIMRPSLSLPLWLGRAAHGRLVPIYNLFNRAERPRPEEGWSVRVTNARDFLGTQLTYDSHNATDFAVPLGTVVVAAAPGVVRRVSSEFNRGGLKVFIDHGRGPGHLQQPPRALAGAPSAIASRGDSPSPSRATAASTGSAPSPSARRTCTSTPGSTASTSTPSRDPARVSLWRNGNWPRPHDAKRPTTALRASRLGPRRDRPRDRGCLSDVSFDAELLAFSDGDERAVAVLFQQNYYPSRFQRTGQPGSTRGVTRSEARSSVRREDFDGVSFPHGVEPPRT